MVDNMKIWYIDESLVSGGKRLLSTICNIVDTTWKIEVFDLGYTYNIVHVSPILEIRIRKISKEEQLDILKFLKKYEDKSRRKVILELLEKYQSISFRKLGWNTSWSDEPLRTIIKIYSNYLKKFGIDKQYAEIAAKYITLLIYGGFYVPLLGVPGITDIFMRLGTYISVESSHDLIGRALTTWKLDDYLLEKILDNIVYRTGISATMYQPTISVTDPEFNIRISAVIGDVSNYRPFITIRVLPREPWLPTRTIASGTADPETIATLGWTLVCKVPVIVFGETGAGKTTLLMALAQYVPPTSRVALIQDIKEIRLAGEAYRSTIIDLIVRYAYASGIREITWEDCFRQALRVTPDYILVPEVRGREARWLLEAFMTGHGGGSTIHAESGESVIERLRLVLREIGIDLRNIAFPILLARVAKTIEVKHGIAVPVRKLIGCWILQRGELIEVMRNGRLDLETLEDVVLRYICKLTLRPPEHYRKLRDRLVEVTLRAVELEKQGETIDEFKWIKLISEAYAAI